MYTYFTNGTIITMERLSPVRSMLVHEDRIVDIGDDLVAPESATVIDLNLQTVVPAFTDCHTHLTFTGSQIVDGSLEDCMSVDELSDLLLQAVGSEPESGILRRWNLNDALFVDRRPTIADLDAISRDIPIILSRVGNGASLLNSAAMSAIGLDNEISTIETVDGNPTGWTWGEANHRALDYGVMSLTAGEVEDVARAAALLALQEGTTTLHAIEGSFAGQAAGPRGRENHWLTQLQPALGGLPITVISLDSQLDSSADLDRIAASGNRIAGGDFFLDGVLGAAYIPGMARAAIGEPYTDGQGGNGHLLLSDQIVAEFLLESARNGVSLGAHAVGERAIAQFLNAWAQVLQRMPDARSLRPRIDHGILPRDGDISRAAELGVLFSMQPVFEGRSGGPNGQYASRIGPERAQKTHRFRSLLDAGVTLVGGSDSPVNRIAPLEGIRSAVNHSVEAERLRPLEALAMFTTNAAYAGWMEKERGSLGPGTECDFAVLNCDIRDPSQLADCLVMETWRAGRKIWSRNGKSDARGEVTSPRAFA